MCGGSRPAPPPPPPEPKEDPAPMISPEDDLETGDGVAALRSKGSARKKLRIDLNDASPSGGVGLNIPT